MLCDWEEFDRFHDVESNLQLTEYRCCACKQFIILKPWEEFPDWECAKEESPYSY